MVSLVKLLLSSPQPQTTTWSVCSTMTQPPWSLMAPTTTAQTLPPLRLLATSSTVCPSPWPLDGTTSPSPMATPPWTCTQSSASSSSMLRRCLLSPTTALSPMRLHGRARATAALGHPPTAATLLLIAANSGRAAHPAQAVPRHPAQQLH